MGYFSLLIIIGNKEMNHIFLKNYLMILLKSDLDICYFLYFSLNFTISPTSETDL